MAIAVAVSLPLFPLWHQMISFAPAGRLMPFAAVSVVPSHRIRFTVPLMRIRSFSFASWSAAYQVSLPSLPRTTYALSWLAEVASISLRI